MCVITCFGLSYTLVCVLIIFAALQGPTQLIKLHHPRLLTIEHQVAESSDTLAFVTEPIFASLANLLGHYDNMPAPLPLIIKVQYIMCGGGEEGERVW